MFNNLPKLKFSDCEDRVSIFRAVELQVGNLKLTALATDTVKHKLLNMI